MTDNYIENRILTRNFLILLALYLVLSIFVQWHYRHEGLNANAIGYFMVAHEYARGNFSHAVNGFYPPLVSWLLAIFIKLGIMPITGVRIVNLLAGLLILVSIKKISYRFTISDSIRTVILFTALPIVLDFSKSPMPDLMLIFFLLLYLSVIFNGQYYMKWHFGLTCGALGAVSYFSKNYAFPFFIAHFTVMNILHFLRFPDAVQRKKIIRNYIGGMMIFIIISGVWVSMLSMKYGYVTFGTAGDYMNKLLGPDIMATYEFNQFQEDDPVYYAGLFKPPYKTSLSVWDDPSYVSMTFFSHKAKLTDYAGILIQRMIKNSSRVMNIIFMRHFSVLSLFILITYVLIMIQPVGSILKRGEIIYPFITLIIFSAGLTPFVVNIDNLRYFWLDNILLLLMGGQVIYLMFRNECFTRARRIMLILIFAISFVMTPLIGTSHKTNRGEKNYILSNEIQALNIHGKIASNDKWGFTLELLYRLQADDPENRLYFYGMPRKDRSDDETIEELIEHDIDYYIVWGQDNELDKFQDVTNGKMQDIKIYQLKE